ncbi:hypothetical protein [Marinicella meishanensis]|uniref:hypothetical protein n=1 Tax=Marinicella meishanensis TaxID=2873263 RepID=UPI001CBEFCBD|nr:hypothetical protein [Marinicella sp. NBU2979]
MKKIMIIVLLMLAAVGQAMDADQLKEAAVKACETQMEAVPAEMREKSKKVCLCNVKKTDYQAVIDAQQSGDMEKIQADAIKNAEACAAEAM